MCSIVISRCVNCTYTFRISRGQRDRNLFAEERCIRHQRRKSSLYLTDIRIDIIGQEIDHLVRHIGTRDCKRFVTDNLDLRIAGPATATVAPTSPHLKRVSNRCSMSFSSTGGLSDVSIELLARQVQMIEDIEKSVLRLLLTGQFLNIVDNQHVEHLVEVDEIVESHPTAPHSGKLGLEFVHRHIQVPASDGLALFSFHADRLRDMRLAKPRIPVYI